MESPKERWIGREAGPIVRPYVMTRGRTRPGDVHLDLVTLVVATGRDPTDLVRLSREQRYLLGRCRRPSAVADLASDLDLPLRVVQVLLGDLFEQGLIEEYREALVAARPDPELLRRLLDELRRF